MADLARSRRVVAGALAPLGAELRRAGAEVVIGPPGAEDLALVEGARAAPVHVAFTAARPEGGDAVHAAALRAGGRGDGSPGPPARYHAGAYSAHGLEPDGGNVEAVHHGR